MKQVDRDTVTQMLTTHDPKEASESKESKLFAMIYEELRASAKLMLHKERVGHTLQPTALVHEAYMRMVDHSRVEWQGKAHFYAVCAKAMHRILIDHARGRGRVKRGEGWQRVALDPEVALYDEPDLDVLAIHDALDKLSSLDARQAQIVELRFFGGLTVDEVAHILGVSKRTVEGEWTHAKAWLQAEMSNTQAYRE
jgi:RNA polymerase sigma factor (TIGR02999 family)